MFTTEPRNESFASSLGTSGRRHWRLFGLTLNVPWFVLTVADPSREAPQSRTTCIAWDTDLVKVLESLGEEQVVGLLCMIPRSRSVAGRWTARAVYEVWELQTHTGTAVVLRDEHGQEFGDGSTDFPLQEQSPRRLILKLDVPAEAGGIAAASTPNRNRTDL